MSSTMLQHHHQHQHYHRHSALASSSEADTVADVVPSVVPNSVLVSVAAAAVTVEEVAAAGPSHAVPTTQARSRQRQLQLFLQRTIRHHSRTAYQLATLTFLQIVFFNIKCAYFECIYDFPHDLKYVFT